MIRRYLSLFTAIAVLVVGGPALAASKYFTDGGAAIRGADPVAYFRQGKRIDGKPDITYDWQGVTWRFASAANRDAFEAEPMKYAPQYGGYCAYAVSFGSTAPTDPDAWTIVRGKLYLNLSPSIKRRWALDVSGNIAKADRNWPGIEAGLK